MTPASPSARTLVTALFESCAAFNAPLAKTRMFPGFSVTNMRPSGANAISHGDERPRRTTVAVTVGVPPPRATRAMNTPSSSIHVTPSITGRRCS